MSTKSIDEILEELAKHPSVLPEVVEEIRRIIQNGIVSCKEDELDFSLLVPGMNIKVVEGKVLWTNGKSYLLLVGETKVFVVDFNDKLKGVKKFDVVRITDLYTKEWNGKVNLYTTDRTKVEVLQ